MIAAIGTLAVCIAGVTAVRHYSRIATLQEQLASLDEASNPTVEIAAVEQANEKGYPVKILIPLGILAFASLILSLQTTVTLAIAIPCGAVLFKGHRERTKQERERERLTFYLPLVMERIVMAVEAGLDVLPALHTVYSLELENKSELDPVTLLLKDACDLAENGATLEQALKDVAGRVDSIGVKHAFIHLALAHRDGGELVQPLRELSDSTQLYYQETMEEMIAKLPVKATLPLVITFGGLIMCFLASPIVQILMMTSKAMLR